MTTLEDVTKKKVEPTAEAAAAAELVRLAKEQGLSLTEPDGLLKQFTKTVLETALNEEMFPKDFVQGRPLLAPRPRQEPSSAGPRINEYPQRNPAENGQKSRCTECDGSGLPGERIGGLNARSAARCRRTPAGASGICFPPRPIVRLRDRGVATTG